MPSLIEVPQDYEGSKTGSSYPRAWYVTGCATSFDAQAFVKTQTGIDYGHEHPHATGLTLKRISAQANTAKTKWRHWVTADYDDRSEATATSSQAPGGVGPNESGANSAGGSPSNQTGNTPPDQRAPVINVYDKEIETRPTTGLRRLGNAGNFVEGPLQNTVEEPLEIVQPVSVGILSLEYYLPQTTFSAMVENAMIWKNAINNALWNNYAAYRWKCLTKKAKYVKENGIWYRQMSVELGLHPKTWIIEPMNAGLRRKRIVGTAPNLRTVFERICDASGHPITEPVPLDADGKPLEPGQAPLYWQILDGKPMNFANVLQ